MRVYVYPIDEFGVGYYRLIWPALALQQQGCDVELVMPSDRTGVGGSFDTRKQALVEVQVPEDADVIVFQRLSLRQMAQAVPMIRAKGIAVVVDMDDDLTTVDPNNPAFRALHPKTGPAYHNWTYAHQATLAATLVTTSTPSLQRVYAPHGRGVVIENGVPARFLDVEHFDSDVFGWPGSVHSHPYDLREVGPTVARLVREGFRYYGIGPTNGLADALGLDFEPEVYGDVNFHRWPEAVTTLGVGLAPLADTAFNRSKSWLKPLEMMACGVPWVGSPRAEYAELRKITGVGLLASDPRDWYKQTKRLITQPDLRADQSAAGRDAAAKLTIEARAWLWWEAWETAWRMQKAGRSAA
jgi:glycosyl transferase family 1